MVANVTAILPLQEVRDQLRIETDEEDGVLTGQIQAALTWVGRHVSRDILDRTELRRFPYPGAMQPVRITGIDVQEPDEVSYYREGDDLTAAPTRTVEPGRWLPRISGGRTISELWGPSGGWPEIAQGSCLEIELTIGMQVADVPDAFKQAAILMVRELGDGSGADGIPEGSSIFRLLKPYTVWV